MNAKKLKIGETYETNVYGTWRKVVFKEKWDMARPIYVFYEGTICPEVTRDEYEVKTIVRELKKV